MKNLFLMILLIVGIQSYGQITWTPILNQSNQNLLAGKDVIQTSSGTWFATATGLQVRNNGAWINILPNTIITGFTQVGNQIWVATWNNGVRVYNLNGTLSQSYTSIGVSFVSSIARVGNQVWIGGSNGGAFFNLTTNNWSSVYSTPNINSCEVVQGNMWFGTNNGLYRWNGTSIVAHTLPSVPANAYVYDLHYDSQNIVWVATSQGLYARNFNTNTTNFFGTHNGFNTNETRAIGEDHNGHIWAGTRGGIFKFNRTSWANNTATQVGSNEIILCIKNINGITYFGTTDKVAVLDDFSNRNLFVNGSFEDPVSSYPAPICHNSLLSAYDAFSGNMVNGWNGYNVLGYPFDKFNLVYFYHKNAPYVPKTPNDPPSCSNYCGFSIPYNLRGEELNTYNPSDKSYISIGGGTGIVGSLRQNLSNKTYILNVMGTNYTCNYPINQNIYQSLSLEISLGYTNTSGQFVTVLAPSNNMVSISTAKNGNWGTGQLIIDLNALSLSQASLINQVKIRNTTSATTGNMVYLDQFSLREQPATLTTYPALTETITTNCGASTTIGPIGDAIGNFYFWTENGVSISNNRQIQVQPILNQPRTFTLEIYHIDINNSNPNYVGNLIATYTYVVRTSSLNVSVSQVLNTNGTVSFLNAIVTGGSGQYTYQWVRPGGWGTVSTQTFPGNLLCRGTYVLTVTDIVTGCTSTINYNFNNSGYAFCTVMPPKGLREAQINLSNEITIYPNPSKGDFSIASNELNIKHIEIYDVMGSLIVKQDIEPTKSHKIENKGFKKGIYIIKVLSEEGKLHTQKIVVE